MGKADIHAHTCHDGWGDGNATIEELFDHVERYTDLDIVGITDHDSTDAARAAWALHRQGGYRFHFLPGVEVTNQAGHLLCLFPTGAIVDIPSFRPFWWTVRFAQARGAICIAAHPVYPPWLRPVVAHGLRRGLRLDGIEAINGGIGGRAAGRMEGIARSFAGRVALVGNSDAHQTAALGSTYTAFPGDTVDDYLRALRERTTRPVFVGRPPEDPAQRAFTVRRSMSRPGWVRNLWRELRPPAGPVE